MGNCESLENNFIITEGNNTQTETQFTQFNQNINTQQAIQHQGIQLLNSQLQKNLQFSTNGHNEGKMNNQSQAHYISHSRNKTNNHIISVLNTSNMIFEQKQRSHSANPVKKPVLQQNQPNQPISYINLGANNLSTLQNKENKYFADNKAYSNQFSVYNKSQTGSQGQQKYQTNQKLSYIQQQQQQPQQQQIPLQFIQSTQPSQIPNLQLNTSNQQQNLQSQQIKNQQQVNDTKGNSQTMVYPETIETFKNQDSLLQKDQILEKSEDNKINDQSQKESQRVENSKSFVFTDFRQTLNQIQSLISSEYQGPVEQQQYQQQISQVQQVPQVFQEQQHYQGENLKKEETKYDLSTLKQKEQNNIFSSKNKQQQSSMTVDPYNYQKNEIQFNLVESKNISPNTMNLKINQNYFYKNESFAEEQSQNEKNYQEDGNFPIDLQKNNQIYLQTSYKNQPKRYVPKLTIPINQYQQQNIQKQVFHSLLTLDSKQNEPEIKNEKNEKNSNQIRQSRQLIQNLSKQNLNNSNICSQVDSKNQQQQQQNEAINNSKNKENQEISSRSGAFVQPFCIENDIQSQQKQNLKQQLIDLTNILKINNQKRGNKYNNQSLDNFNQEPNKQKNQEMNNSSQPEIDKLNSNRSMYKKEEFQKKMEEALKNFNKNFENSSQLLDQIGKNCQQKKSQETVVTQISNNKKETLSQEQILIEELKKLDISIGYKQKAKQSIYALNKNTNNEKNNFGHRRNHSSSYQKNNEIKMTKQLQQSADLQKKKVKPLTAKGKNEVQ